MGVHSQHHAPAALLPGKKAGTHCTGGLVCRGAGLNGRGKSLPYRESIPEPFSS
jgi:hypothetical protein